MRRFHYCSRSMGFVAALALIACSGVPADDCSTNGVGGGTGTSPCAQTGGIASAAGTSAAAGNTSIAGASTGGTAELGGTSSTIAQATGGALLTGGANTGGALATGGVMSTGGSSSASGSCIGYVKIGGSDSNDGTSWNSAFATVQKALNQAATKISAGNCAAAEVWVAAGTYYPTEISPLATTFPTVRDVTILLKAHVALYGGFAGTETALSQRSVSGHVTTLSGDIGAAGDTSDNAYHVTTGASDATIDGFTITLGNASPNAYGFDVYGGGMYNQSASPTVSNCVFKSNSAGWGGAIYNSAGSSPAILNCVLTENTASSSGGAIYNTASSPSLKGCLLLTNRANNGGGGGIYNTDQSSPWIDDTIFVSNSVQTGDGGGMYNCSSCMPQVSSCQFIANSANNGGGMFNYGANELEIENSMFRANYGAYGGALYNYGASPHVVNCTFESNSCTSAGAGMYNYAAASPTIVNSIFWGNRVGATIVNFTNVSLSYPLVTYSDVQGGCTTATDCTSDATGNIDADPLFVSETNGDLSLRSNSPCIDAASTSAAPVLDHDGNPRVDVPLVGNDGTNYADMGAYEYQP